MPYRLLHLEKGTQPIGNLRRGYISGFYQRHVRNDFHLLRLFCVCYFGSPHGYRTCRSTTKFSILAGTFADRLFNGQREVAYFFFSSCSVFKLSHGSRNLVQRPSVCWLSPLAHPTSLYLGHPHLFNKIFHPSYMALGCSLLQFRAAYQISR